MPQPFSASKAAMMMSCSASADLSAAIPGWTMPPEDRTADNAANRGTARHKLLEPIMELSRHDILGMAKILMYVAELRAQRRFKVMVEQKVTAEWLDSRPTTTADLVLYTQDEIHILDQKWGKIAVDVVDNAQLLFYAACYAPLAPKAKGVTLHIMQPPLDKFESTYVSAAELGEFMDAAKLADKKIADGVLDFGPSDHCQFCPANPHSRGQKGAPGCPVMLQMLYPRVINEDEILNL